MTPYRKFPGLLRERLTYSGSNQRDIPEIAAAMGIHKDTLYKYLEGVNTFPPDLLPALYIATGDVAFFQFLLAETDLMLARRPHAAPASEITSKAFDIVVALGKLSEHIRRALSDGMVSDREKRLVDCQINVLQKELEDLRACLG